MAKNRELKTRKDGVKQHYNTGTSVTSNADARASFSPRPAKEEPVPTDTEVAQALRGVVVDTSWDYNYGTPHGIRTSERLEAQYTDGRLTVTGDWHVRDYSSSSSTFESTFTGPIAEELFEAGSHTAPEVGERDWSEYEDQFREFNEFDDSSLDPAIRQFEDILSELGLRRGTDYEVQVEVEKHYHPVFESPEDMRAAVQERLNELWEEVDEVAAYEVD